MLAFLIWILKTLSFFYLFHHILPPLIHGLTRNRWTKVPLFALFSIPSAALMAWLSYDPVFLAPVLLGTNYYSLKEMEGSEFEATAKMTINKPLFWVSSYLYILLTWGLCWFFQLSATLPPLYLLLFIGTSISILLWFGRAEMPELGELAQREKRGQVTIGIDRIAARQLYTNVSIATFAQNTGEAPYLEKTLVIGAYVFSPLTLLASIVLAVIVLGWWAILVVPVGLPVWVLYYSRSSLGETEMISAHLFLAIALGWFLFNGGKMQDVSTLVLTFAVSLWLGRFVYSAATVFLRAFVLRNSRALAWLRSAVTIRENG